MGMMLVWLLLIGGAYLAALVVATLRARRGAQGADVFLFAGSRVGLWMGFLTTAATLFSTFALMGLPDLFRTHGVGAWFFLALPDGAMVFLMIWFGFHLRRRIAKKGYQGMAGLLEACYGQRIAGYVYLGGIFVFLIPYAAIQIRGISAFMEAVFLDVLPLWAWATLIVVAMLIYSEVGGLKAIIFSDAAQGLVLTVTIVVVAILCTKALGGIGPMFEQVGAADPALLSVPGPNGFFTLQYLIATFFAILMVPVTQPQVSVRLAIMKDTHTMHRMLIALGIFSIIILLAVVPVGLYGAVHFPLPMVTAEYLANTLVRDQPPVVGALVLVGLVAAAMSTVDSQVFAMGTELRSMLTGSERTVMRKTKIAIVVFALVALAFALLNTGQIAEFAREGFAGLALLGPMLLAAVLMDRPPSPLIIFASAGAMVIFLLSLVGLIPSHLGSIRLDLLLFLTIAAFTLLASRLRPAPESALPSADAPTPR